MFTPLKSLKWAYNLGVRQERVRIAAHLQAHSQAARTNVDFFQDRFRDGTSKSKFRKSEADRLSLEANVNARVERIIDEMFKPNGEYTPTSIMFPDGKYEVNDD